MAEGEGAIRDDIRDEGVGLATAAAGEGLQLRLMGGLAVWATSRSVRRPPFARTYPDIDLAGAGRSGQQITTFLVRRGYVADRRFNALHGAQRLNFTHPAGRWFIDVLLDAVRMSHTIVLRDRLSTNGPTLDLADLLLTKLQIWEINAKDVRDAAALLADHELVHNRSTPTVDAIDVDRIAALTGADWGLSHTLERNLGRVLATVEQMPIVEAPHDPAGQVANVLDAIARGPKSLAWRARARVGERVRWYQTPEEVRREGVSS